MQRHLTAYTIRFTFKLQIYKKMIHYQNNQIIFFRKRKKLVFGGNYPPQTSPFMSIQLIINRKTENQKNK